MYAPLLTAIVVGAVYVWRFVTVRRDSGSDVAPLWRALAFCAGLTLLVAALIGPLDELSERLFIMHMVQHLLLVDVGAILLVCGLNRALLRPAVKRLVPIERTMGQLAHPLTVLTLLVVVMIGWHVPALYELALNHDWAHSLEHMMFLAAGLAFWWYLLEPVPPRHRLSGPGAVSYIFAAKVLIGVIGVGLAFSTSVWYPTYEDARRSWGLTALEDQNIGGVVMMIEQSVILLGFFVLAIFRMLERSERDQQRSERLIDAGG